MSALRSVTGETLVSPSVPCISERGCLVTDWDWSAPHDEACASRKTLRQVRARGKSPLPLR